MPTHTPTTPEALAADIDTLTQHLLDVIARAPQDPLSKGFAALSAAGQICAASSEVSPALRVRLAKAALVLVRTLASPDELLWEPDAQQPRH